MKNQTIVYVLCESVKMCVVCCEEVCVCVCVCVWAHNLLKQYCHTHNNNNTDIHIIRTLSG